MPSNQTAHYALNQWVKSDQVRMEDFNADNAKLDAALKAAEQRSAGLDAKIDAAVATAEQRSAAVAAAAEQRAAALDAAKGNCTIEFFSYVGQGRSGSTKTTITFREPPLFFFVFGSYSMGSGSKHCQNVTISAGNNVFRDVGSWSGNTISFSNSEPRWQLDTYGETFYVFAFYAAG